MPEITVEGVNEKLAKDVPLSKEETQFVMSLPPDGTPSKEADGIDWANAEDVDSAADKEMPADAETTALAQKAKTLGLPETATKEEITAADTKANNPAVDTDKLEVELAKPEGQEVLDNFSTREKAYFHQMRRDRKRRQQAEEDRDRALFDVAKLKRKDVPPAAAAEEDPLVELDKRDPADYMTVEDVKNLFKTVKSVKKETKETDEPTGTDPRAVRYLSMCDQEARVAHPDDYDAVMELMPEIVPSNPDYLIKIQEATQRGENPADVSYELIKKDPEFSKLIEGAKAKVNAIKAAAKKKTDDVKADELKKNKAQAAQDALEKNKDKTKTTGHADGEGNAATETDKIDGYSLIDIYKMSALEFAKLPPKTRKTFLEKYG